MLLSGSRFGLARCCLYSFRPEVQVERVESEDANRGTGRHKALECLSTGEACDFPAAWGCSPAEWPEIETAIREWLPSPLVPFAEQAMYLDVENGLARGGAAKGRDYCPEPGEIPMTIDLVFVDGDAVEVWDYKTGWQENLEPAESNGQLAICCLAAARSFDKTQARGVLAIVADDGTARIDRVELDSLDLDAIAYEVRGLQAMIPTSEAHPGPWCKDKWCAARAVCPATREAMVRTPLDPLALTIDSPEVCARVHVQIGLAEEFLEAVKRARNAWLEENPGGCELADGSTLMLGIEERDSIECTSDAKLVLSEAGLESALELKTSKAAIERAVKSSAPKGEAAQRIRDVMERLDAVHAIRTSQFTKIKIKKGRKAA